MLIELLKSVPVRDLISNAIKARDSKYPKGTRVYTRIDLGTGRTHTLFCTDKNMELLDVKPMEINYLDN